MWLKSKCVSSCLLAAAVKLLLLVVNYRSQGVGQIVRDGAWGEIGLSDLSMCISVSTAPAEEGEFFHSGGGAIKCCLFLLTCRLQKLLVDIPQV